MKLRALVMLLCLLSIKLSYSQNVSNKGKLFWVGHMGHIDGTGSNFALYLTTDAPTAAAVRISIPGTGYTQTVIVPSNQVTVHTLPSSQTYLNCSDCIRDQGVKVESLNHDIVVYAHIYANARSDATLLIPVETLGKEYYTISFTQNPSSNSQRSEFMVIAVEDSTYVDIYPSTTILPAKPAGTMYTVMLNTGEVYHAQAASDVTGTRIVARSANGISCKSVAAFSGSSFTKVGCASAGTGDNLYQQLFPTTSWGMEFVTAPLKSRSGDQFRILAKYDTTKVLINGVQQLLHEGDYYDFVSVADNYLVSDKPITLAQYPRTQNCDGNTGDPTLIVIPPLEQSVTNVTMYSSPYQNITGQYLNIITKLSDTALLRLDGVQLQFTQMTNNSSYAYARETVSSGNHRIQSDSLFQVISYGFGNVESYGYAGGTNIKNLVQSISSNADSLCFGDTFLFRAEVNYIPTSLKWYFGDGTTDTSDKFPRHSYAQAGSYTVSLVTRKSGLVDCGSTDSTIYRVRVHDYPKASFSVSGNCLEDTFGFTDQSQKQSSFSYISKWAWTFGDSTESSTQNPTKYFSRLDSFKTKLIVWNNNLCADSIEGLHFVNPHPQTAFTKNDTCPDFPISFADASTIYQGTVNSWNWLIDSSLTDTNSIMTYSSSVEGTHFISLETVSDSGCSASLLDSFVIYQKPTADFAVSSVCLEQAVLPVDQSQLADFFYWDLEDTSYWGSAVSYVYKDTGTYTLQLKVEALNGCMDSLSKQLRIYPVPPSDWKSSGRCLGNTFSFSPDFDTSVFSGLDYSWSIAGSNLNGAEQQINFSNSGQKAVSLTTQTNFGCSSSSMGTVYVNPVPVSIIQQDPVCEFQVSQVTDISNWNGASLKQRVFTWNGITYSDSVLNLEFYSGQSGSIKLWLESDSLCADSNTLVPDYHELPSASFDIKGICPDSLVQFESTSIAGAGSVLSVWEWLIDTGAYTGALQALRFEDGGLYPSSLIVVSDQGCKDTAAKSFRILDIPVPSVSESPSCINFPVFLEDNSFSISHQVVGWSWVLDGQSYQGQKISEAFPLAGYYSYSLSVTTDSGCVFNDIYKDSIRVYPGPQASFIKSSELLTSDRGNIEFESTSLNAYTYFWDFGDGSTSILNPVQHIYTDTGGFEVWLVITNSFGCRDSISDSITVKPPLSCFIPNAFTPNEDFTNESFLPVCEGAASIRFKVWNRWGQVVHDVDDFIPWQPTGASTGVYAYEAIIYDYAGDWKLFRGNITLIR